MTTRHRLALVALFSATFVFGTAELLVVGLIDLIADDVGVSVSRAGSLVTAYAIGFAVGAPLLTALTLRLSRGTVLRLALAGYLVATATLALAPPFGGMLAARAVGGALHGLFVGAAIVTATTIVPPERVGRAISVVASGIAVSTAVGVPMGTFVGRAVGWQGAFGVVAAIGCVTAIAVIATVPASASETTAVARGRVREALSPAVLAVLGVLIVVFAGQYAALTYLTPFLHDETGVSGGAIGLFLLAYGVATAVGSVLGGRAADWNARASLVIANVVVSLALTALYLVATRPALVVAALLAWGLFGFGLVPSMQRRVVDLAGSGADLASSFPASAANAGIAIGSLAGGSAIASHGSTGALLLGIAVTVVAIPLNALTAVAWRPGSGCEEIAVTEGAV